MEPRTIRLLISIVTAVCTLLAVPLGAAADVIRAAQPDRRAAVSTRAHIKAAAARYGVSERLVSAIITVESGFNSRAVSARGARGLMQLMPRTAARLGVRDAFDPSQNIGGGVRLLRQLLDRFGNNVPLVLAAYNAGETAVIRHGGVPPFPETQAFVARVLRLVDGESAELSPGAAGAPMAGPTWTAAYAAYASPESLAALREGLTKEEVFEAFPTQWLEREGRIVKQAGLHIRDVRRSGDNTLVEIGELLVADGSEAPALYWLLFEDRRLKAFGRDDSDEAMASVRPGSRSAGRRAGNQDDAADPVVPGDAPHVVGSDAPEQ